MWAVMRCLPQSWEVSLIEIDKTHRKKGTNQGSVSVKRDADQCIQAQSKTERLLWTYTFKHCLQMKWLHNSQPSDMLYPLCLLLSPSLRAPCGSKSMFSFTDWRINSQKKIAEGKIKEVNWSHDWVPHSDDHERFCWHKKGNNTSMGTGQHDILGSRRGVKSVPTDFDPSAERISSTGNKRKRSCATRSWQINQSVTALQKIRQQWWDTEDTYLHTKDDTDTWYVVEQ